VPQVTVACNNRQCRAYGVQRRVLLQQIAVGVLARPALLCATCSLNMAEATDGEQQEAPDGADSEEDDMAKVTVHGGPSIEGADPQPTREEWAAAHQAVPDVLGDSVSEDAEGGEQSSPGSSSETSSGSTTTSDETSRPEVRQRARSAGSRSGKGRTDSSTAASTGGDQTGAESGTGSADSE
jgi:hypothetical protein